MGDCESEKRRKEKKKKEKKKYWSKLDSGPLQ